MLGLLRCTMRMEEQSGSVRICWCPVPYNGDAPRLKPRDCGAGYALAHVKLTSTWAAHCPAYYVALSLEVILHKLCHLAFRKLL